MGHNITLPRSFAFMTKLLKATLVDFVFCFFFGHMAAVEAVNH